MEEMKKAAIPRGPAATKAKNKYRDKAYDRMELAVPKGLKAIVETAAEERNLSKNAYIVEAIKKNIKETREKKLFWKKNKNHLTFYTYGSII